MTVNVSSPAQTQARQDILHSAAQCFMDQGYASTSIDDVARRLGSTKGRIYHHYRSKADLFFDVYRTGMTMSFEVITPIVREPGPAGEKLSRMAKAHCRAMIQTQAFQRCVWEGVEMLMHGATTPSQRATLTDLQTLRNDYSDIFRTVLEQAGDDGSAHFHSSGIALQLMFMVLNSPLFWYSRRTDEDPDTINRIAYQCTEFAMRGLLVNEELFADV